MQLKEIFEIIALSLGGFGLEGVLYLSLGLARLPNSGERNPVCIILPGIVWHDLLA
jgi:hypothetical protein